MTRHPIDKTTMQRALPPAILMLILTLASLMFWSLHLRSVDHSEQYRTLSARLADGIESVNLLADSLLDAPAALPHLQERHDRNVALFRSLVHGNLKQGLPGLLADEPDSAVSLETGFDGYAEQASSLIQQRSHLDRFHQSREQTLLEAQQLAQKANALVAGMEQIRPDRGASHLQAAYRTNLSLERVYSSVLLALTEQAASVSLPMDQLAQDLAILSTDAQAPESVTIRRSAANLLKDIKAFAEVEQTLRQYHTAGEAIRTIRSELSRISQPLKAELNTAPTVLSSSRLLYSAALLTLAGALIAAAYFGFSFASASVAIAIDSSSRGNQPAEDNMAVSAPSPFPEAERSRQITDRNKLMNDIRPLGEGILYLKADEHLETTADLARCLNQSREALVQRVDRLKAKVKELENSTQRQHTAKPEVHINTGPVDNLTYRALAELEGLQRKLESLKQADNELVKYLIQRCMNAESYVDEIRLRVSKGWQELIQQSMDQVDADSDSGSGERLIQQLVGELVKHMDEIQTQPPPPRRKRS